MGQIFHASAYDTETKICCVIDADKFHANCYSHSGAVLSMHYLLRQKPYRIMWGGGYIVLDNNISACSCEEDLLGVSTYEDYEDFERNHKNVQEHKSYDKIKFIGDNSKTWNRISVWDEAKQYFDYANAKSVRYDGYLLNLTKKQAVNLADYYERAKSASRSGEVYVIDPVPVLTETGGGSAMAFFDGISADSTEGLAGKWCGDLLQIVSELPDGYELTDCCFTDVWGRVEYCYNTFGVNSENLLINDKDGKLFEATRLNLHGNRGYINHIKVEPLENGVNYIPVQTDE